MAPKRTNVLSILLYFFACFCVLKAQHLTPDAISNTLDYIDCHDEIKESFIYSSMHIFQQDHCFEKTVIYNHENISLFTTVLLLCGDIETCLDPVTLPELCKCRGLKFMYQNIRGLTYNFTSLEVLVYKEDSTVNVLGLSEAHIIDGDEGDYAGLFKRLHTDEKKSQP